MPPTTIHSILGVPQLLALIVPYLTSFEIVQCMGVCKAWTPNFQPYLWRNFRAGLLPYAGDILPQHRTAIRQNLHLIQTVDLSQNAEKFMEILVEDLPIESPLDLYRLDNSTSSTSQHDLTPLCTNLKRLKLPRDIDYGLGVIAMLITTLLCNNPNLTHLDMPLTIFQEKDSFYPFVDTLACLRRLRHITFRGELWATRQFYVLCKACLPLPELSEVFFDFELDWNAWEQDEDDTDEDNSDEDDSEDPEDMKVILSRALKARSAANPTNPVKIKAMRIPDMAELYDNPMPALPLLRSHLLDLESFTIPWFFEDKTEKRIEKVVRKHCPRLKRLACAPCYGSRQAYERACEFIEGCSGLTVFQGTCIPSQDCVAFDFKELTEIIWMLVEKHSQTLEDIEFLDCAKICSEDLQKMLSRCTNLKRFWIAPSTTGKATIEFEDICNGPWVCTNLRELRLMFARRVRHLNTFSPTARKSISRADRIAAEAVVKHGYAEIGKLKNLEVLTLEANHNDDLEGDATACEGWLAELSGLKKLRHLLVGKGFQRWINQYDVELMHAQWPLLSEVTFIDHPELKSLPHWQWLREKRPNLQYH
ncbi:hypothetical protein BGX28_001761 [Mortierella sp. GBA30]|nr:hypothetical protein BGX28_001761 [Mortierella sp. GBA30]